ncbi:DUF1624 domain-containing protein [Sphingomonas sp. GB1N7]|uniref:DUF1624 domain-containing protein n=1 Tax=Parasphingomonas caseinilytica TaxID=3096158 RepID=UPI002FC747A3
MRSEQALPTAVSRSRIAAIDRLRGLVMLLMLVDHTREFFFIGHQVSDPMDLTTTSPALAATRLAAHLCAPIFVALTGLAAWLYGAGKPTSAVSAFLLKRGAFLILLEVTLVNFAWTFALPPTLLYLQVIWAIGIAMLVLAGLVHLPRGWIATIGVVIVAGHNLLDPIAIPPGMPGHAAWAVLHDRGFIDLGGALRARTSYPVLPWIGAIALGYAAGPWFAAAMKPERRQRLLTITGAAMLSGLLILRLVNGYGDPAGWSVQPTLLGSAISFLNLTKYPPSLDFLLLTLGIGTVLLAIWDRRGGGWLAVLGGAPLFFYLLHLYVLHLAHLSAAWISGDPKFEVPSVGWLWAIAAGLTPPLWWATRWFAGLKRRSTVWWIRYL